MKRVLALLAMVIFLVSGCASLKKFHNVMIDIAEGDTERITIMNPDGTRTEVFIHSNPYSSQTKVWVYEDLPVEE